MTNPGRPDAREVIAKAFWHGFRGTTMPWAQVNAQQMEHCYASADHILAALAEAGLVVEEAEDVQRWKRGLGNAVHLLAGQGMSEEMAAALIAIDPGDVGQPERTPQSLAKGGNG